MDIEIDYIEKFVTIRKPVNKDKQDPNFFWLGYPIVTLMDHRGVRLNFGLDTGARKTSITDNILEKVDVNNVIIKKKTIGSAGGFERIESKIIPYLRLVLSGYELSFRDIGTNPVNPGRFIKLDGILGSDIFNKGRIKIDILNGRFEFKPSE